MRCVADWNVSACVASQGMSEVMSCVFGPQSPGKEASTLLWVINVDTVGNDVFISGVIASDGFNYREKTRGLLDRSAR